MRFHHSAVGGFALSVCVLAAPPASGADAARLTLEDAERAALASQPLLEAQAADVRAAESRAVSAGALPDPRLTTGFTNVGLSPPNPFSPNAERMTMTTVGVMQEFPLASKRKLRSQRERLAAAAGGAELQALERRIRRDAALAFLDVYLPERAVTLTESMATEAARERGVAEIEYRAGRAPQADVLAADVELELLRDRVRRRQQDADEAREKLARWIGEPARAPTAETVPAIAQPPLLPALLAAVQKHPELEAIDRGVESAETALRLARQEYRPDWRVEAEYGYRRPFGDMVSLHFGIDLPFFTGNRQDRDVIAARETLAGSQERREDARRQLVAEAAAAYRAWSTARERLARYDAVIVPAADARARAALAAYRAGATQLAAVLDARRAALDVALMRLELQVEILRRLAELRYLNS